MLFFLSFNFIKRPDYWWLGFSTCPELSFTHVRDWLIRTVRIYGPNCILKNNSNIIFILAHHLIHLDWPLTLHPKFSHPHAFQYNITLSNIISSQYYSNQNTTKHLSSHLISFYYLNLISLFPTISTPIQITKIHQLISTNHNHYIPFYIISHPI